MLRLWPSENPHSPKPRLSPTMRSFHCAAETPCSTPIEATRCCARAANGQATAKPTPRSKSRRLVCRERSIVRGDGGRFTTAPPALAGSPKPLEPTQLLIRSPRRRVAGDEEELRPG